MIYIFKLYNQQMTVMAKTTACKLFLFGKSVNELLRIITDNSNLIYLDTKNAVIFLLDDTFL